MKTITIVLFLVSLWLFSAGARAQKVESLDDWIRQTSIVIEADTFEVIQKQLKYAFDFADLPADDIPNLVEHKYPVFHGVTLIPLADIFTIENVVNKGTFEVVLNMFDKNGLLGGRIDAPEAVQEILKALLQIFCYAHIEGKSITAKIYEVATTALSTVPGNINITFAYEYTVKEDRGAVTFSNSDKKSLTGFDELIFGGNAGLKKLTGTLLNVSHHEKITLARSQIKPSSFYCNQVASFLNMKFNNQPGFSLDPPFGANIERTQALISRERNKCENVQIIIIPTISDNVLSVHCIVDGNYINFGGDCSHQSVATINKGPSLELEYSRQVKAYGATIASEFLNYVNK